MILLNTQNLSKSFAGQPLFKGLNFGIESGERIGLVGPNGAGKSTLLKILAGIADADDGSVTRKKNLRLGYLEQTPTFKEGETIYDAIQSKSRDPDDTMVKAYELMGLMGIDAFPYDFPVAQLSGGWQKRVALARELVNEPELLMLDEPTNHLDVKSILWLEEFLSESNQSVLMVTHDRLFLQRTVNRIMDLDPRLPDNLLKVNGDYAVYLEAKEQLVAGQLQREKALKNTFRRETEWLRRGAKARQTKQQARIKSAGELGEAVSDLKARNRERVSGIEFGEAERSPKKLIKGDNLSKTYEHQKLFEKLDLLIGPQTRIALLGTNGSGKSTLINILLGKEKSDTGKVEQADELKIAHFEQSRDALNMEESVLKNICPAGDYVNFQGTFVHVRSYLDRFMFYGRKAELPAGKLSGGERARLRIAQLMLESAQVLVLDEPTNDLDMETLEVLENALADYKGAVVLVTHDRFFMDAVADQILAFPPMNSPNKELVKFASYFQWEEWQRGLGEDTLATYSPNSGLPPAPREREEPEPVVEAPKKSGGPKVKMTFKEKHELSEMEGKIMGLESKVAELQAQSTDAGVVKDHAKLAQVLADLAKVQEQLDTGFARWAELEAKAKDAGEA